MTKTNNFTHDVTNDQHRAECGECAQLWAELDAISAEASLLPTLTPSRDLWSGIESRLGGTSAGASGDPSIAGVTSIAWYRSQTFRLAIAASLLVATSSAVTWRVATGPALGSAAGAPIVATATDSTDESAEESAVYLASFSASVAQMDHEISTLQKIVTERRGSLDPKTLDVVEKSLAVIDAAIAESRAALEADPASQFLAAQFTRAYNSKLTLLRDVATLRIGI